MKFFIDAGNIKEIRQAAELAILDGVTTNPSLIAKENMPFKEAMKVLDSLLQHPLTDKGLTQFLKDWERTKQN